MKILIYNDKGCSASSVESIFLALHQEGVQKKYKVDFINQNQLSEAAWMDETALLIFPGGLDKAYHQALTGKPNSQIRCYVESGGAYLGICAGGYYGSASIEFERGNPLEIIEKRELAFFPGIAAGPAYGLGQFCYRSAKEAKIAALELTSQEKAAAYYYGGCYFADAEKYSNTAVIARYREVASQPAAVIHCTIGKGRAVLCGVHPEYSSQFMNPLVSPLFPALRRAEPSRKALFSLILSHLLEKN